MKAERRHELQHNEIADWLAEAIERVKPYSRAIAGVALAAAVLLTAYVVLSRRAESKQSTAWNEYYQALQSPSNEGLEADLEAIAREHQSAVAGLWAAVTLADLQLDEGVRSFFFDRRAAEKKLQSAAAHYEAVVEKADDPLLRARALYGLGRAQESLGHLDEARRAYRQIVDAEGSDAFRSLARLRLDDLERDSTKDFYAWFETQEPAGASSLPSGSLGERFPFDESGLGSPGDLNLSGDNILNIPGLNKGPALTTEGKATDAKDATTGDATNAGPSDTTEEKKDDAKPPARDEASDEGKAKKDDSGAGAQSAPGEERPANQKTDEGPKSTDSSQDDTKSAGTSKN
jgi:tetratricopeptide (TPR) repeat protein